MASSDGGHIKLSYVVESFAAIDYRIYLKFVLFIIKIIHRVISDQSELSVT